MLNVHHASKAKQAKQSCNKTGEGRGLDPSNEYEIMKLKIDNIRTVNETPIPCSG